MVLGERRPRGFEQLPVRHSRWTRGFTATASEAAIDVRVRYGVARCQ